MGKSLWLAVLTVVPSVGDQFDLCLIIQRRKNSDLGATVYPSTLCQPFNVPTFYSPYLPAYLPKFLQP